MSVLRMPKMRDVGAAWDRVWDRLAGNPRHVPTCRKPRRLVIDPLEERQLLSVSPANLSDVLINQLGPDYSQYIGSVLRLDNQTAPGDSGFTTNGQAVAVDNNGDFVVTWTRFESRPDPSNPTPGATVSDANIYARYYTDAVQRITLPAGTTSFKLQYNGNEVQKLSLSAGATPFGFRDNISGQFDLTLGGNTATIGFDESQFHSGQYNGDFTDITNDPILNIQHALWNMGGALADATVEAIDTDNYLINFGNASGGVAQSTPLPGASTDFQSNLTVSNANFSSGFLAAVDISVVRRPGQTVSIPVSSNPALTAANIQYAFQYTSANVLTAPVMFPQDSDITPDGNSYWAFNEPITFAHGQPTVTVTARGVGEFDITFTGDSGKQQQPLMKVLSSSSTLANPILLAGATSTIIKQSSDEFRVNAPEPDDPNTLYPDVYDQTNARVAMDSDGDFVITWESTVPDSTSFGSVTDIFARRFSPAGYATQIEDLTFTLPDGTTTLSGTFTLDAEQNGVSLPPTGPIAFSFDSTSSATLSASLSTTAENIRQALIGLGYNPDTTSVTYEADGTTVVFQVSWAGADAGVTNFITDWTPGSIPLRARCGGLHQRGFGHRIVHGRQEPRRLCGHVYPRHPSAGQ